MPTIEVTVDRIKALLKQNGMDPNAVTIQTLKEAIYKTATASELQNINRKIKTLRELGIIKEITPGFWKVG